MKINKKLLAASVAAMFIAAPAYADVDYGNNTIPFFYQDNLIDDLIDDALDLDDAMVRVISAGFNFAPIDASVSITGASIDFNAASDANAISTATADSNIEAANATVNAISSATSGNAIRTNAIGAVNDTEVKVANTVKYDRDYPIDANFILTDQDNLQDAVSGGIVAGVAALATGLGGFLVAQDAIGDTNNGVAVFQAAYNTGDINASVIVASTDVNSHYRDTLDIRDLAISTSAIGAVNQGGVDIVNNLLIEVSTSVNYNVGLPPETSTELDPT